MTTMEMLKLAEEVADLRGVYDQFSSIYLEQRQSNIGILSSVKHALDELKLWDTYREYS